MVLSDQQSLLRQCLSEAAYHSALVSHEPGMSSAFVTHECGASDSWHGITPCDVPKPCCCFGPNANSLLTVPLPVPTAPAVLLTTGGRPADGHAW